ncbi:MFS transporter [Govanella unica]|uniref:MFS transporter n=1 Tax=Govanella unica TaxID=2975056 RepID=A0A9X3Z7M6_9PROT|nr:MFS transporter [Govania unica]MDA5194400.1 MFS transporter [Govania unica]
MAGTVQKNTPYAWYVAILLSSAHLISFIDRFVMSLVLVPIKTELGLSDTQLGLLHGTGFVILYTVAAIPLGRMADLGNRRNLIIGGILIWSLATTACGLANSFNSLFAARIAVGFGEAALVPAAMSLIAAYFSREKLSRAVGTFTMGASLGKSVALIIGGATLAWLVTRGGLALPGMMHASPWQGLFILASLPGVAVALLLLTVREPARVREAHHAKPSVREVFAYINGQRPAYLWHTIASAAAILLVQSYAAWAPTFYIRFFAFTPAEAGLAVGMVVLVAGPLGHITGGYLTDKFQARGVTGAPGLVIGSMLVLAILPAVIFCTTRNQTLSLAAYGLLTFCTTAAAPPGLSGIQLITPERLRGIMSACFLAAVTFIAIGMGPTLIGIMTDKLFGNEQALGSSLLLATIVFAIFGAVAARMSRAPAKVALAALAEA